MARSEFAFFHPLRVRFSEVDRQGLAHNSTHLVYFGIALNEYFRDMNFDRFAINERDGADMHVVQAQVNYKAPIEFDQEIEIGARIARLGRSSVQFCYEIFPVGEDRVLASGEQVWVNTDRALHKSTSWSPEFRAAVEAREGPLPAAG
jgi:acyl-CoA thioester hydrolase